MSFTDPISDMLTRIRNGIRAGLQDVVAPYSNIKKNILTVLTEEGYIKGFEEGEKDGKKVLKIRLKYTDGTATIREITRLSKPGRRAYASVESLKNMSRKYNLGTIIISTSKGVVTNHKALTDGIGGEVLCVVL